MGVQAPITVNLGSHITTSHTGPAVHRATYQPQLATLPLPKDTPAFASFGLGMLSQLSTGLFPSVSSIDRRPGPTRLHRFLPVSSLSYRPDAEVSLQELT